MQSVNEFDPLNEISRPTSSACEELRYGRDRRICWRVTALISDHVPRNEMNVFVRIRNTCRSDTCIPQTPSCSCVRKSDRSRLQRMSWSTERTRHSSAIEQSRSHTVTECRKTRDNFRDAASGVLWLAPECP
jgi:hypothetical protein